MSKPEWNEDTPKWASWLAQDADGSWWWYDIKPRLHRSLGRWIVDGLGMAKQVLNPYGLERIENWKETLEPRP